MVALFQNNSVTHSLIHDSITIKVAVSILVTLARLNLCGAIFHQIDITACTAMLDKLLQAIPSSNVKPETHSIRRSETT